MNRRNFIERTMFAATGLATLSPVLNGMPPAVIKIGIIGLDTSHAPAFTKIFNSPGTNKIFEGFRVVAAYPYGSADIESSVSRIPKYTEEVKAYGVEVVTSVERLLKIVDVVLLETNDGRPHKEQAFQVLDAGKPMFIDKPLAASLEDAVSIYDKARLLNVPVFSTSSLRYMKSAQQVRYDKVVGNVLGADTFSPATLEPRHPDLFWYGIHGVELLFTVMGAGCESVTRHFANHTDVVVGRWKDGRIGTFRGTREGKHEYGGTVFGTTGNLVLGPFDGYEGLAMKIAGFFRTGVPPVNEDETIEIYTFMEAADESKRRRGAPVALNEVLDKIKK